jgi:hypothetical protein
MVNVGLRDGIAEVGFRFRGSARDHLMPAPPGKLAGSMARTSNREIFTMNGKRFWFVAQIFAALILAAGTGALAWERTPEHFRGTISDYTPLNSTAKPTGPYEMRGHWSLDLKPDGKADFSAFMTMELSDYWVWFSNSDPSDPLIRGAHTHHIIMTDDTVTYGGTGCPPDSPTTTTRLQVNGTATFITGNGNSAPFEKNGPTKLQVCITGGSDVTYSNMTLVMKGPANGHFGTQAIHGVVRFLHKEDADKDDDRH